jgi:alginate O-acetyltransferase complex protein AlgI
MPLTPLSVEFWLFLAVVLFLHNITYAHLQNIVLLAASYFLYAWLDWRFLGLLILATTVTYLIARQRPVVSVHTADGIQVRRLFYVGVLFNLGILGLFKYAGFFVSAVTAVVAPFGVSQVTLNIVLPFGISFYIFRLLSYLFDVYHGRLEPSTSWVEVALYTSFFPQIAAGPIERASRFLPALRNTRRLSAQGFVDGLTFICLGLVYKIAIADPLVSTTDNAFNNIATLTSHDGLAAMILFSIRLYADFAGYSALAIGISTWFGLPAMENFRQPYFAQSVVDFWTRWHISLSTWFRDYLFYPLSRTLLRQLGTAQGFAVQLICYFITMVVIGLWHGANWTFIVWGILHGSYMVIERLITRFWPVRTQAGPWQRRFNALGNILVTQVAVAFAWVIFRAPTLPDAIHFFQHILVEPTYNADAAWWARILYPVGAVVVIDLLLAQGRDAVAFWRLRLPWRVVLCTLLLVLIFIFGGAEVAPFVYFQF